MKYQHTGIKTRLDQFFDVFELSTRALFQKHIKAGRVLVNGEPRAAAFLVRTDQIIEFSAPQPQAKKPVDVPIVYEDNNYCVVNKPAGLLVHAKHVHDEEFTLHDFIINKTTDDQPGREGVVHRLDRETSGLIVLAKNVQAREHLQQQFADRKIKKSYVAVAHGVVKDATARFEWPLARNPNKPYSYRVYTGGKESITGMELLSVKDSFSYVRLLPKTGRTHQLRVHMSHYGHPIVGDALYGKDKFDKLYLHAAKLAFISIDGKELKFEVPPEWKFSDVAHD